MRRRHVRFRLFAPQMGARASRNPGRAVGGANALCHPHPGHPEHGPRHRFLRRHRSRGMAAATRALFGRARRRRSGARRIRLPGIPAAQHVTDAVSVLLDRTRRQRRACLASRVPLFSCLSENPLGIKRKRSGAARWSQAIRAYTASRSGAAKRFEQQNAERAIVRSLHFVVS